MTVIRAAEKEKLARLLSEAELAVLRYNNLLNREMYQKTIDEIAFLVEDSMALLVLGEGLVDEGWEKFNEARDSVRTAPIRSLYSVRYHFYRHPKKDWRLEIMQLEQGISPLHAAILPPLRPGLAQPVHASFKCSTEERYAFARTALERQGLDEAQRCDSTYGRFSYWTDLGRHDAVPYLKPRVNLRDMPEEKR